MKRIVLTGLLLAAPAGSSEPVAWPRSSVPPQSLDAIPVSLVIDLGSNQPLYARQPELSFVPASVTKVMTAYVALELMAAGKLKPSQSFNMDPKTWTEWAGKGTSLGLNQGEAVQVDTLLRGITTVSANDAAIVLAQGAAGSVPAWAALMNAQARNLGMTHSRFATPNGWPDGGKTYVSASDLVRLGEALISRHPQEYRRYFGQKSLTWNGVTQTNRDPMIGVVPGADGIKTGHTNEAGYNFLGTAIRDGRRVMVVIAGARSEVERAKAARDAVEWAFAVFDSRRMFAAGARVASARVQNGDNRSVSLVAPRSYAVVRPTGSSQLPTMRLRYRGPLIAPIAKGDEVARLEFTLPGQPPWAVPLVAGEAISRAGPLDRLWNGVMGLVS